MSGNCLNDFRSCIIGFGGKSIQIFIQVNGRGKNVMTSSLWLKYLTHERPEMDIRACISQGIKIFRLYLKLFPS
jgi:hypothetical protein